MCTATCTICEVGKVLSSLGNVHYEIEAIFTERDIIVCVIAYCAKRLRLSRVVPQ